MKKKNLLLILLIAFQLLCLNVSAQNIEVDISNISLPECEWSLYADFEDFKVEKNDFTADGTSRQIMAVDNEKGLTVSVFIEKVTEKGDHIECRKHYWSKVEKSPLSKDNLKKYEKENIAIVEHDTKEFNGHKVDYHSVNAYMSYEGYWIDVHISKMGYKKKDKVLFDQIVSSLKIENPKKRNLSELFLFGFQSYYMRNYEIAIKSFELILETEKDSITIDKTIWRVVVDNLGMAYGISGDYDNSKKTLMYGIKLDSEYPNFYYNLACTFAEMSDFDNAILNLELAYSKKGNLIEGEKLTNPRFDSSFKKYMENEKLLEFLKKYSL